jgi:hypothetical protein
VSRYYHRTSRAAADEILRGGFRDSHGRYLTESEHPGVWIPDVPLDENESACGDTSGSRKGSPIVSFSCPRRR